ncbi:MAG: sensor domain-containing diguanylate cyclase [Peptostreptococcaceae bacterium]|nr:sensor domain-containing diguanylate cyclase [Peptostreptococcaceae bacterium]
MEKMELYNTILSNTYEGIYFVDTDRTITFWNGGAEKITGFLAKDVIGRRCRDNILNHVDETGKELCIAGCPLLNTIQDGKKRETSVYLHHKDGHRVPVSVRSIPLYEGEKNIGGIEVFIDDSEKHEVQRNIEEYKVLAMLDQLTLLPNRRHIDSFLSSKYKEYRELEMKFGILFMDIDKFKLFNDNYGHDVGDEVLRMISKSFLAVTRATDLIGRFGGEEFIAVLVGVDEVSLTEKAERIRMLIENCALNVEGKEVKVTISIGATMVMGEDTIETLLKRADALLYKCKEEGRNRVSFG